MSNADGPFDIDLLSAARSGDLTVFAEIYRRHSRAVLRYSWAKVGSKDLAEENLQETFATAWAKRDKAIIVDESLLPWLLAISRNHVNNQLRKRRRHESVELRDDLAAVYPANTNLAWMQAELANLSPIDRRVCELCLVDGLTYRQAAELIGASESATGKRLQRARARLRAALEYEE